MRQILLKALASGLIMSLFPYAAISAPPKPAHADSLLTLLPKTPDAAGRERIYVQLADLSGDSLELAAPHWEAALARSAQGRGYLRMQRCAGLSGSQIRRPRHPAGREIHRPRRQHSPGFPLRPVPFIALRLLPLETDERQQFDRNGNACAGRTQSKTTIGSRRGAHRMGTPDRPGHRLFVGHNRSLRQHRQGDPLCGASAGKPQEIPARKSVSTWKRFAHDELSDLYMLCKDQGAPKSRSGNVSTCTANGWRWTTASNGPTATRRAT